VKFSIPFLYYFITRINSIPKKVSWSIVNVFPILWVCAIITDINSMVVVILYFLGLCAMMSIYEVGYLENDIITTKNETNPTKRLDDESHNFLEKNYNKIISMKYGLTLLIVILSLIIETSTNIQLYIYQFIFSLLILRVIYLIHNKIRNKFNILTFLGLVIFKHYSIILLFIPFNQSLSLLILLLILFCGQRLIEYASKKRFGLNIHIGNLDVFRVYYFLVCLVSYVLYFVFKKGSIQIYELLVDDLFFPLALYLFIFRLLLLLAGRVLGVVQANE
jgi:hypothetical protein